MFEKWVPELCGYRTLHVVDRGPTWTSLRRFSRAYERGPASRRDSHVGEVGRRVIAAPYMRAHQIG